MKRSLYERYLCVGRATAPGTASGGGMKMQGSGGGMMQMH